MIPSPSVNNVPYKPVTDTKPVCRYLLYAVFSVSTSFKDFFDRFLGEFGLRLSSSTLDTFWMLSHSIISPRRMP